MADQTSQVSLLDCTLRDGSYSIQFQFTEDDTFRIVQGLDKAGIPLIEVGHGLGLHAQNSGLGSAATSDRKYIEAAAAAAEETDIGVFYIPGIGRQQDIEMAADAGADFIRIGQNVTEWEGTASAIDTAVDCGLTVCGNLMKSYAVSPETVAERCSDLEQWGADVAYIVDSAGGMLPEEVAEYVSCTADVLDEAAVGFHCHDNLDLAVANSLQAIESGAEWIDATLQGIGRSAGNTRLETLSTVLEKRGKDLDIDQKLLMDLGSEEVAPLLGQAGMDPVDITAGYALFHTKFLESVLEVANEYDLDVRDLIVAVSKQNVVDVSQETIETVAEKLSETDDLRALERRTAYLQHSRRFEPSRDLAEDRSSSAVAKRVNRVARKHGKTGVLSITPAFRTLEEPQPTVLHRNDQAVFGNMQVADSEQAVHVLQSVDGIVDTVAIDTSFTNTVAGRTTESSIVRFDDRLAIARAITYFIDDVSESTFPSITVLGKHPVVEPFLRVSANRGWTLTLCTETDDIDYPGGVNRMNSVESAVSDADLLVALGTENEQPVGEDTVARVPEDCVLLDAGIRNLSRQAIEYASERGLEVFRSETRAGYISEIECALITRELFDTILGSRIIDGIRIVAGGIIGKEGDVVVDSIDNPEHVYGIADGTGGLVSSPSEDNIKRMEAIARRFGASRALH